MMRSPLATSEQRDAERLALKLIETPEVRAAREASRALLLADPVASTPDGRTGLDRALDQWVLALVMRVINADPFRPTVVWNVYNPARHWFGHSYLGAAVAIDNPDNSNREIPIDGGSFYEIRGRFGSPATQFTIEIVTDFDGYAGIGRTLAALTSQTIVTDADGSFVITVGGEANGRPNHLPSEPGRRTFIFCRDSMADWNQVPTTLSVARVGGPEAPPSRDAATIVADVCDAMPGWVRFWNGFKDDFLGHPEPNRLVGPIGRPGGWGFLYGGRFRVDSDDAIVVTTVGGGASYTGFQIADPWTISPDPVHRLASLNKTQSRPNPDGSTTYVLAARDPGVHNWIDTSGLMGGWMLLRWQGVPSDTDPALLVKSVERVKLVDLGMRLPAGTPVADIASRSRQVAERIAEHARRLAE